MLMATAAVSIGADLRRTLQTLESNAKPLDGEARCAPSSRKERSPFRKEYWKSLLQIYQTPEQAAPCPPMICRPCAPRSFADHLSRMEKRSSVLVNDGSSQGLLPHNLDCRCGHQSTAHPRFTERRRVSTRRMPKRFTRGHYLHRTCTLRPCIHPLFSFDTRCLRQAILLLIAGAPSAGRLYNCGTISMIGMVKGQGNFLPLQSRLLVYW
jgi:hypothetical protein